MRGMTTINFLRYNRACVALDIRLGSLLPLLLSLVWEASAEDQKNKSSPGSRNAHAPDRS